MTWRTFLLTATFAILGAVALWLIQRGPDERKSGMPAESPATGSQEKATPARDSVVPPVTADEMAKNSPLPSDGQRAAPSVALKPPPSDPSPGAMPVATNTSGGNSQPTPRPVATKPPSIEDLRTRFDGAVKDLVQQSQRADAKLDQGAFWSAFCEWLDQQQDVPASVRSEFRCNLSVELGLGPKR